MDINKVTPADANGRPIIDTDSEDTQDLKFGHSAKASDGRPAIHADDINMDERPLQKSSMKKLGVSTGQNDANQGTEESEDDSFGFVSSDGDLDQNQDEL